MTSHRWYGGVRLHVLGARVLLPFAFAAPAAAQDTTGARAAVEAPVRFLVGGARLRSTGFDGGNDASWGTALGLRIGFPAASPLRAEVDVRLQAAGLRGPCTRTESARRGCAHEPDAQSLGDLAASLGLSFAPTSWVRASALVSPRLNTRGIDRAVGAEHVNWSARPWGAAFGLDVAAWRSARLLLEYRVLGSATYAPDSQSVDVLGATPVRLRGDAFTVALALPLRPATGPVDTVRTAASPPAWTSFGLVVENDLPWRDESYTNGLRAFATEVPVVRDLLRLGHLGLWRDAVACPYGGRVTGARTSMCRVTQVALTQTMHTPVAIYRPAPQPRDRPFAGTLFASARTDVLRPDTAGLLLAIGSEFQVGVMGPSARSEQTQSMAHWLIATGAARPAGWPNQADDRLHAVYLADVAYRGRGMRRVADAEDGWLGRRLNVDLTGRANGIVGTTHVSASGGLIGRWSPWARGLPLTTQRALAPTILKARADTGAVPDTFEAVRALRFALVASLDGRLVGRNQTLVGTGITPHRALHEVGAGLQVEKGWLAIAGTLLHRSREFTPRGATVSGYSRYWTAQVAYRPSIPMGR